VIESLPQGLAEWVAAISQYGGFWIYIFVFIAGVTENIFPPFPGDSILFAGGVLASAGLVWWPLVLVCGVVGNVIGAMTVYWFGYSKGRHYFITHHGRLIDEARLHRIENWFERYGTWIIIGSRFLTGIRSGIALCAGLGEVPASQMLLYTTLSTLLWNSVIITLAFLLGSNWNEISEFAGLYNRLIIGMLVAIAAGWGIRQFALKRARQRTEP
jgi:membrane protein DedA with SNARE-associated domain